ncbi:MAG: radical SAM protein [Atopobiaceae bacterium]|nr:radical SAM protein [Atopobiaceae bacterium]
MAVPKRVRAYAEQNFNEVYHCTLNPDGPGVVRIHLVPPLVEGSDGEIGSSVAIINGQDVIPVNVSWSILLIEFIREVNRYDGRAVTDEDVENIQRMTCKAMRKVYPFVSKRRLRDDIYTIMTTFTQVARGEPVDESIQYVPLGEYAPFMRAPHRMDLLVSAMTSGGSWRCNQRCVHCYAAGQELAEEAELSTDGWKRIIDKCRDAGITQVTFTGGEPTMREDLFELIDHARWFVTRLNTNGVRLTREYCDRLHEASLDSVQVTLYSHDASTHNELVGVPRHADTVAGIENALAAGLNLSVNTPLCTANRDYLQTLEFLHELGVTYVTCSGLIVTGNATRPDSRQLQLNEDELKQILRDAVSFCHAHDMEISFTSPGWVEPGFCQSLGIPDPTCGACLSNMAVTPGGHVVPCQSWLSESALGDMLADDWDHIWNGERCLAIRAASAKMDGGCPLRAQDGGSVADATMPSVANEEVGT